MLPIFLITPAGSSVFESSQFMKLRSCPFACRQQQPARQPVADCPSPPHRQSSANQLVYTRTPTHKTRSFKAFINLALTLVSAGLSLVISSRPATMIFWPALVAGLVTFFTVT